MKKLITTLCLALVPSISLADSAFEQLARASGADVKPLMMQVTTIKQMVERPAIPRTPIDVLGACSAIDAKTFRAYNLTEAAGVLNGCLNDLYASDARTRRAYTVQAVSGRFAVRACAQPKSQDMFSCQAFIEVEGLIVTVTGDIMTGDPILENLNYSISKRSGKVLGFYASVDNKAAVLK